MISNGRTNNPIPRNHVGPVTKQQAHLYNILLTRLSEVLSKLITKSKTGSQNSEHLKAIKCWETILIDLSQTVLPEMYVVFHDETTDAKQRRRLYDVTQAILFTFSYYDNTGFLPYLAQDSYNRVSRQVAANRSPVLHDQSDHYAKGKGYNAEIAHKLLEIANYVKVDGRAYIDYFAPYYNLLIAESDLRVCLLSSDVTGLKQQLKEWQKKRLLAFSIPSLDTIVRTHALANARVKHALCTWILQEYITSKQYNAKTSRGYLNTQHLSKRDALALQMDIPEPKPTNVIITAWTKFKRWVTGTSAPLSTPQLLSNATRPQLPQQNSDSAKDFSLQVTPALRIKARPEKSNQQPNHEVQAEASDIAITDELMPLSVNQHAYHLAILLTANPTSKLKQLITATNVLYGHIDYLKEKHPYLADSVEESIKDLVYNTIVRLDETASQFVTNGKVDPDIRAIFKQKHESRIERLISLNLSQIKDLNKTIIDKKMSGFEVICNQKEHKFRETIMELKILLRWLIAQQPDELQATNYQVILDKLESSTLADMQTTFFASYTNDEQRDALQHQLEQLLNHFKQQTDIDRIPDDAEDEKEIQALLELTNFDQRFSKAKEDATANNIGSRIDNINQQLQAADFIEYNKHYIEQLLKHWN